MNHARCRLLLFAFLTGALLSSCGVTRPYAPARAQTAGLFRDAPATDTASLGTVPWPQLFADTVLQGLIRQGIARNLDLQVAYTRIQQAEAYYRQSQAAFFPTLGANAGVTRARLSQAQDFANRGNTTQYQVGLASSWEIDVWGRLRSNRRANLASLLASEEGARAVQTGLVANIANYYYLLQALDEQVAITRLTVVNWDTTVQTMRALKIAARVTEAAVVQSLAQRYAAEVILPDLQQQIRETENALSILLARPPAPIRRGPLDEQQTVALIQTGVPAQLLANRPDVRQAEQNYRYYFELTNVARAYFYPALTLTGSAGPTALAFANVFNPGYVAASVTAGLAQPIFNQRLNRTRLAVARAQQQAAALDFQAALLNAGREVSDALSLHQTALDKMRVRTQQMTALQQSVAYSQELLQYGFATYPEVITARQSLLQAELNSVNDRLQRLQAVVSLYRSLGGGWR